MQKKVLEYNAIFQKEVEGGFSVWIPDLPGCTSQGETFEEATENIREAVLLYLDDKKDAVEDLPDVRHQFMVPISVAQ